MKKLITEEHVEEDVLDILKNLDYKSLLQKQKQLLQKQKHL